MSDMNPRQAIDEALAELERDPEFAALARIMRRQAPPAPTMPICGRCLCSGCEAANEHCRRDCIACARQGGGLVMLPMIGCASIDEYRRSNGE